MTGRIRRGRAVAKAVLQSPRTIAAASGALVELRREL
jgi:hypothetical protein